MDHLEEFDITKAISVWISRGPRNVCTSLPANHAPQFVWSELAPKLNSHENATKKVSEVVDSSKQLVTHPITTKSQKTSAPSKFRAFFSSAAVPSISSPSLHPTSGGSSSSCTLASTSAAAATSVLLAPKIVIKPPTQSSSSVSSEPALVTAPTPVPTPVPNPTATISTDPYSKTLASYPPT
eukprot:Pompholyxophrys_punicea_v1_NODE_359_length_2163_cov_22.192125.p1 type:complete len:182 gc:universal NODE_359_length_2163_cov_22.192125:154-699(+)